MGWFIAGIVTKSCKASHFKAFGESTMDLKIVAVESTIYLVTLSAMNLKVDLKTLDMVSSTILVAIACKRRMWSAAYLFIFLPPSHTTSLRKKARLKWLVLVRCPVSSNSVRKLWTKCWQLFQATLYDSLEWNSSWIQVYNCTVLSPFRSPTWYNVSLCSASRSKGPTTTMPWRVNTVPWKYSSVKQSKPSWMTRRQCLICRQDSPSPSPNRDCTFLTFSYMTWTFPSILWFEAWSSMPWMVLSMLARRMALYFFKASTMFNVRVEYPNMWQDGERRFFFSNRGYETCSQKGSKERGRERAEIERW